MIPKDPISTEILIGFEPYYFMSHLPEVVLPFVDVTPAPTYRELFKILHGDEYTPEEEMCDE